MSLIAAEKRYRMAIRPWKNILSELRADRGMLLGTEQFKDMTGVEQCDALSGIESRVKTVELWIDHYEQRRKRLQRGWLNRRHIKQIHSLSDEDLVGDDE